MEAKGARARLERGIAWARSMWQGIEQSERAWRGATWGIFAATAAILGLKAVSLADASTRMALVLLGVPLGLVFALAGGIMTVAVVRAVDALPARFRIVLAASLFVLSYAILTGSLGERAIAAVWATVPPAIAGAAVAVLTARRTAPLPSRARFVIAILGLVIGFGAILFGVRWMRSAGVDDPPAIDASAIGADRIPALDLPDPSMPGPHGVQRIIYGSGHDLRRPEYGARVDLRTKPVDGEPFLRGWGGFDGRARARYWGFDEHALPLNGRMFYPDGPGPFPLVVAVHGGHPMNESSEPGYDYLGEHLATRGFVFVSIDENFLNGGLWTELGGLTGENGARAFVLLEHLRAIRAWSDAPDGPLHGKIDMRRIALAGHSKGGEAITLAALFNRLRHFPDDANVRFDYGFGIKSLIALSITDKQFQPAGAATQLDDIDYLALQGSNDGDVEHWQGMQQFERVSLSGAAPHFKLGVFVHRANHGQWNRVWGRHDKTLFPKRLYFNRRPLLPAAAQERVAKTWVSAFLAVSLAGDARYLPFLKDHRRGKGWLPDTIYVTRYDDSSRRYVSRFEEDVDVTTTTLPGGRAVGEGLLVWREQPAGQSALWNMLEGRAAYLGWDRSTGKKASYTIELPQSLDPSLLVPETSLVFGLADANEPAGRRPRGRARAARDPIDLTIELADRAGHVARFPLGSARFLQAQLETTVWKSAGAPRRREIVFQTFELPLGQLTREAPGFTLRDLGSVRFVFDRTPTGVVVLDDVGFAPAAPP